MAVERGSARNAIRWFARLGGIGVRKDGRRLEVDVSFFRLLFRSLSLFALWRQIQFRRLSLRMLLTCFLAHQKRNAAKAQNKAGREIQDGIQSPSGRSGSSICGVLLVRRKKATIALPFWCQSIRQHCDLVSADSKLRPHSHRSRRLSATRHCTFRPDCKSISAHPPLPGHLAALFIIRSSSSLQCIAVQCIRFERVDK